MMDKTTVDHILSSWRGLMKNKKPIAVSKVYKNKRDFFLGSFYMVRSKSQHSYLK